MSYLLRHRHYLMKPYSQNVQICIDQAIHLLQTHQWANRVSITFLRMMRIRNLGVMEMAMIYRLFHHHKELTGHIITCRQQVLQRHQALENLQILVCHHWLCHMVMNQKLLWFQKNQPLLCHRSNLSYLTMMRTIRV